jgi:hypothetical protein
MKITLCGSTRFHERFRELNGLLTKHGHVVYSVALAEKAGDPLTAEDKIVLDLVHLRKISESDAIVVIGAQEDGTFYIGESTSREIMWALMNGKDVFKEKSFCDYHQPGDRIVDVLDRRHGIGNPSMSEVIAGLRKGYSEKLQKEAAGEFDKPDGEVEDESFALPGEEKAPEVRPS